MLLKLQQRFKSETHNFFTEEINRIALSWNSDKIVQSTDSIQTYVHEMSEDLYEREKRIRLNIIGKNKKVSFWLYYKRRHKRT